MRTICLLKNSRGEWFVHTRSGGETVSSEESFDKPGNAKRAFFAEGRHQPYARMVLELAGAKPVLVRGARPVPALDEGWREAAETQLRAAMSVRKIH